MTAVSKNAYFDMLEDIPNKYNSTVHRSIKMKPIDVTSDSYDEYNEDSNVTTPKFKVGDHNSPHKLVVINGTKPKFKVGHHNSSHKLVIIRISK